jgi:hypothetical protein
MSQSDGQRGSDAETLGLGGTGAERVAARLRGEANDPAALARDEVRFVAAIAARRAAPARVAWLGAGVVAAVALVVAAVAGLDAGEEHGPRAAKSATLFRAGLAIGGRAPVRGRLGHATLELAEHARARVLSDTLEGACVRLERGEVRVVFEPLRRGEEHLAIDTPSARVEVVGTAFLVRVGADGATRVEVSHGVVEVLARASGVRQRLTAGASLEVPATPHQAAANPPVVAPPVSAPVTERPATSAAQALVPTAPAATEPAISPANTPTSRAAVSDPSPSSVIPSIDAALAALDTGDEAPCLAIAARGPRASRLDALEALADHRERRGAVAAAEDAYARLLVLDPRGARGATARFARASLRERVGAPGAADDFARYLADHPRGALAAQARAHLCALDPARCAEVP